MSDCSCIDKAVIIVSVYSGIVTVFLLIVLFLFYRSRRIQRISEERERNNNDTARSEVGNINHGFYQDTPVRRDQNNSLENSVIPKTHLRHALPRNEIRVKQKRVAPRFEKRTPDSAIQKEQKINSERYIEIITQDPNVDFQSVHSSTSSENTVYNDVMPSSRHNSAGSENTVYDDAIPLPRQISVCSDSTLYNDVIDASPKSSISSDSTACNESLSNCQPRGEESNFRTSYNFRLLSTLENTNHKIKISNDKNIPTPEQAVSRGQSCLNQLGKGEDASIPIEALPVGLEQNAATKIRSAYPASGENSCLNVNEFQNYLKNLIKSDPKRYSNLLKSLPRFKTETLPNSTYDSEDEYNSNGFHLHSEAPASFILKFLRAGNYNFEAATKILINYIILMRDHPQYYKTSLQSDAIQKVYDEKIHTVLVNRDRFQRRVFIWRPGRWNPDTVSFTDCYCAMYMLCEMMAQEPITQINGCTVVCDGSNIGFRQLKSMCLEDIRNSANFIQETLPLWFRQVHVVNVSNLLRLAYNMIKPFVNDRVKEGIVFHNDLDSFHSYVDKEILPHELGGTAGPFDNAEMASAVHSMSEYFVQVHAYVNENSNL